MCIRDRLYKADDNVFIINHNYDNTLGHHNTKFACSDTLKFTKVDPVNKMCIRDRDRRFAAQVCNDIFRDDDFDGVFAVIQVGNHINALKRAIVKQEHYFIKLFVCPPLNELILN